MAFLLLLSEKRLVMKLNQTKSPSEQYCEELDRVYKEMFGVEFNGN